MKEILFRPTLSIFQNGLRRAYQKNTERIFYFNSIKRFMVLNSCIQQYITLYPYLDNDKTKR